MTAGSTMPFSIMDSGLMDSERSHACCCTRFPSFSLAISMVSMAFARGLISSCAHSSGGVSAGLDVQRHHPSTPRALTTDTDLTSNHLRIPGKRYAVT